jgi:hypothetical protein
MRLLAVSCAAISSHYMVWKRINVRFHRHDRLDIENPGRREGQSANDRSAVILARRLDEHDNSETVASLPCVANCACGEQFVYPPDLESYQFRGQDFLLCGIGTQAQVREEQHGENIDGIGTMQEGPFELISLARFLFPCSSLRPAYFAKNLPCPP